MKKLFMGLGITILTILMLVGVSFAYTYDGDIDPSEFISWEQTSEPVIYEPGVTMIELSNTTGNHPDIDVGKVYLIQMAGGATVLAYQYNSKSTGKTRFFELHPGTNNYDEVNGFSDGTFEERYVSKLQ